MVELQSIARATQWRLDTLHKEPDKLQEGLTVLADGADWNPGSGAGVYTDRKSTRLNSSPGQLSRMPSSA